MSERQSKLSQFNAGIEVTKEEFIAEIYEKAVIKKKKKIIPIIKNCPECGEIREMFRVRAKSNNLLCADCLYVNCFLFGEAYGRLGHGDY